MRASLALHHYDNVLNQERACAQENETAIAEIAEFEDPELLGDFIERKVYFDSSYTCPRPSQYFMHNLFERIGIQSRQFQRRQVDPADVTLAHDVLMPMAGVEPAVPHTRAQFLREFRLSACDAAEEYFVAAYDQVMTGRYHDQKIISIYHDNAGQPIIFRKKSEESSGLALQAINVAGISVPAGTIVGLPRRLNTKPSGVFTLPTHVLKAYPVDAYSALGPVRFSPWVYDQAIDRACFAVNAVGEGGHYYDPERGQLVESRTIEDFQQAAEKVLALCGIA